MKPCWVADHQRLLCLVGGPLLYFSLGEVNPSVVFKEKNKTQLKEKALSIASFSRDILRWAGGQLSRLLPASCSHHTASSPDLQLARHEPGGTTCTYIYDQILHRQGAGQLGDLVAELVYVLKRETKVSEGVLTSNMSFLLHARLTFQITIILAEVHGKQKGKCAFAQ